MARLRVHLDSARDTRDALATAQALALDAADCPALLYGAPLTGRAVVLGAHQHQPAALARASHDAALAEPYNDAALAELRNDAGSLPVLRRSSGGVAVLAGEGVVYVALKLREPSALVACPPGKLLNRYARGVLQGLRAIGVQANYFGRDFISAGAEPVSYLGWSHADDDSVCIESFLALDRPFVLPAELDGYPPRAEPPFRGRAPTTVRASTAHAPLDARVVLDAVVEGHVRALHAEPFERAPSEAERARATARCEATPPADEAEALCWSTPVEEAIGFVLAGVRLDADGRFDAVRVRGDFFQHERCGPALDAALRGQVPSEATVGRALDQAYAARPGLLEGLRTLRSLQAAVLDAAEHAQR